VAIAQPGGAGRRHPGSARRTTTTGAGSSRRTCGGVRVHSVYVPNGRSLDNEFYGFKLEWLARLRTMLDETCRPGDSVAVCGDFNVAPDDGDVWDPAHFVGATHVSEPERAALRHVEDWGLDDVFRRFNDPGVFTWWDYRAGDFHQGRGMRIDLVLVSDDLAGARHRRPSWIGTPVRGKSLRTMPAPHPTSTRHLDGPVVAPPPYRWRRRMDDPAGPGRFPLHRTHARPGRHGPPRSGVVTLPLVPQPPTVDRP
jgi:hypothetical protein